MIKSLATPLEPVHFISMGNSFQFKGANLPQNSISVEMNHGRFMGRSRLVPVLKTIYINVLYQILVASLSLMALF